METRRSIADSIFANSPTTLLVAVVLVAVVCNSPLHAADGVQVGFSIPRAGDRAATEARIDHFSHRLRLWISEGDEDDTIEDSNPEVDDEMDLNDGEDDQFDDESDESDEDAQSSFSDQVSNRERVTKIESGRFVLPPLMAPSIATAEIGNGKLPDGFRGEDPAQLRQLPESGQQRELGDQEWPWTVRHWAAANTFSHPRYFEDRMLERHGHEHFPLLQPMVSGARFFATVPMLPYLMTVSHPCDCEYTLGYYRPGTCAPCLHQRPPFHAEATVVEAAAIAGGIIALP